MTDATRSFRFSEPADDGTKPDVRIDINGEEFHLVDDLEGFELLRWIGLTNQRGGDSTISVVRFLERVVKDEDWERFIKLGDRLKLKPADFGRIAGDVIDAYAAFPTTQASGSTSGQPSSGSTSE